MIFLGADILTNIIIRFPLLNAFIQKSELLIAGYPGLCAIKGNGFIPFGYNVNEMRPVFACPGAKDFHRPQIFLHGNLLTEQAGCLYMVKRISIVL